MFRGWVLDAWASRMGGVVLSVSDGVSRVEVGLPSARFHLYFRPRHPAMVAQLLEHRDVVEDECVGGFGGLGSGEEEWYEPPWYRSTTRVAHLVFRSLPSLLEVERSIVGRGEGEVYNSYPDRLTQLFWRLGYPPTTMVEVGGVGVGVTPVEDPLREDYPQPCYSWAELRLYDWYGEAFFPLGWGRPSRFSLVFERRGERVGVEGEELGRLEAYVDELGKVDVLGYPKPYAHILLEAGLNPAGVPITLDRRSPHSEGVGDALVRLVEWSRVSYMPLSLLASSSIGKPLTANEARMAFERRWLTPSRLVRVEPWRSLEELQAHDRGGTLFRPKPGVYFNVAQFDFASMYPSLIQKWNISPESVNNPYARQPVGVPGTVHTVDLSFRGVVPEALDWLIRRRERLRALSGERGDGVLELRQAALKWLLVASFGYLGFRNARFGKIEAYECVTALAREMASRTVEAARSMGYRVLHVMVDSVFVQRFDEAPFSEGEIGELASTISGATGLNLKLEALYDWVVFSRDRRSTLASPQRYFGRLTATGKLKLKGLECVKRSSPLLVKCAQLEALQRLGEARSPTDFSGALEEAWKVLERWRRLVEGDREELEPALFTFCVRGARRAVGGGGVDGYVWLLKEPGPNGFHPAEWGYRAVDKAYYLRLLDAAWEQIDPTQSGWSTQAKWKAAV
ncbi:MAG: DNA polymerase domain-containing protein [Thermoprotei archaeon]